MYLSWNDPSGRGQKPNRAGMSGDTLLKGGGAAVRQPPGTRGEMGGAGFSLVIQSAPPTSTGRNQAQFKGNGPARGEVPGGGLGRRREIHF